MAIEIIPKEAAKLPLWQNILFYLSLILLLTSISGYLVLHYVYYKKAELALDELEIALEKGKTPQQELLKKEILNYQKTIEDFSSLLSAHQISSKFFISLEKICHPKVFFTKVNLNIDEKKGNIFGKTESFQALGQQLLIFKKDEMIKSINLSNVGIGKGGDIEFTLGLSLWPELFK
ncbi:hypothetical protein KJA15_00220 [Patescibacteria group bacterium]|nr:hypothetical protein [Patescibacteria group bacterium]